MVDVVTAWVVWAPPETSRSKRLEEWAVPLPLLLLAAPTPLLLPNSPAGLLTPWPLDWGWGDPSRLLGPGVTEVDLLAGVMMVC